MWFYGWLVDGFVLECCSDSDYYGKLGWLDCVVLFELVFIMEICWLVDVVVVCYVGIC